jgi:RHS repeat-associated protein
MGKLLVIVASLVGFLAAASTASAQTALPRAGWVATASTSSSSDQPSKAIDGSSSTRFSTGVNQTAGQWFSLDMITPQTFSQITIDPAGSSTDFTKAYQVFVSNDAVTWSEVASGTGAAGILTVPFPTQTARFVGVVQTGSGSNWWSIAEFNVYGAGAQPPAVALTPTGWVATASVTGGSDVASKAIDGSTTTRWSTGTAQVSGQSFQLDMLSAKTLAKITMNSAGSTNDYARAFQVFATNNTSNWGTAIASGTGTSALVTVTLPQTSARYVKIALTGGASNWWSIAEITVFAVGTFDPVAMVLPRTGWTATASSTCGSDTPAKALDDNASTRWSSGVNQASGQYFLVDMLTSQSFTKITLDAGSSNGDYARAFSVYATNDTSNWGSSIATGTGSGQLVTINFAYQNARYIKVVLTASASSSWWSIHEFNVYGIAPYLLMRDGWVASASLNSSAASSGIDGKLSTRWTTNTNQTNGQYYQLDMLAPQSFNQVVLNADGSTSDYPRGYKVLTSNDGTNWSSPVATGTGSSSLVSIGFPTQVARYIRIVLTGSASNWWSIAEFHVYGAPSLITSDGHTFAVVLTPAAMCTYDLGDGTSRAVFGYFSGGTTNVHVPVGLENQVTVVGQASGTPPAPPAWFMPGLQRGAFVVTYPTGGTATWALVGRTVSTVGATMCSVESGADGLAARFSADFGPQANGRILLLANLGFPFTGSVVSTETSYTGSDQQKDAVLLGQSADEPGPIGPRAAGAIPAEFHVTDDGAAQYEIPVVTPPGRAGVEPHLRLVYNSRAGDGALGPGWTIAGLSKITRCARTRADAIQDNSSPSHGVQFSSNDELCLDGERLVRIGGGTNALGEYRTQRDVFAKILVATSDGFGPRKFVVFRANGRIDTYGSEDNTNATSRVDTSQQTFDPAHPQGTSHPARAAWYLSQITDRFQNALTITYVRSFSLDLPFFGSINVETEAMPDEIRYTRNDATGRLPDRSVKFNYAPYHLSDLTAVASAGWLRARAKRVSKIDIKGPNPVTEGLVRQYRFAYGATATDRRTLQRVQVCDGSGACQAPTSFTYQPSSAAFQQIDTGISDAYLSPALVPDDRSQPTCVALGTCAAHISYYILQNASRMISVGDVNGDGLDDLIYRRNAIAWTGTITSLDPSRDPAYLVRFGTGSGFTQPLAAGFPAITAQEYPFLFPHASMVDLDLDGRADAVLAHRGAGSFTDPIDEELFISTGSMLGPFRPNALPTDAPEFSAVTPSLSFLVADLIGGGRPEFLRPLASSSQARVGFREPDAFEHLGSYNFVTLIQPGSLQQHPVWDDSLPHPQALDLDGDGRAELIYVDAFTNTTFGGYVNDHYTVLHLNNGGAVTNYSNLPATATGTVGYASVVFIDYNGDGLKDALIGNGALWLNTGTGFVEGPTVDARMGRGTVVDFDGDGLDDVVYLSCPGVAGASYAHPTVFLSHGNGTFAAEDLTAIPAATSAPLGEPGSHNPCLASVLDANGDGLPDIVQAEANQTSLQLYLNRAKAADRLSFVTNGIGSTVSIEYGVVTATSDTCVFPEACGRKVQVVSAYEKDNGTGGDSQSRNRFTLEYQHPVTDLLGRGWQGFSVKRERNQQTGQTRTLTFDLRRVGTFYPFAGMPASETVDTTLASTGGAVRKVRQVDEFANISGDPALGPPFAVRPRKISEHEFEGPSLDLVNHNTVTRFIERDYDSFGNLTKSSVLTSAEGQPSLASDQTAVTYVQDTNAWLISQLRSVTRSSVGPNGEAGANRLTTYETDPATGLVRFTHVEPAGAADERIDIETQFNPDGNVQGSIARDVSGNLRVQTIDYDEQDATFPATIRDALDHSTRLTYHQGLGVLIKRVDPNGATASWVYDGLGRVRQEQTTAGPSTLLHYLRTPSDQGYGITWGKTGGGFGSTTFDSLGRDSSTSVILGFDGAVRSSTTTYDRNCGNVQFGTQPSAAGTGPGTLIEYDEVGRPIQVGLSGQQPLFIRYSDLAKTIYQGMSFETAVTKSIDWRDAWGRTTSSQNVLDQMHLPPGRPSMTTVRATTTDFEYGPFGQLRFVRNRGDAQVITTEDQYDRRGRRVLLIDADAGPRQTHYNAFGDVVRETDAMGVDTIYDPDQLGRPRTITKAGATDTFTWDSSSGDNGLGQLGSSVSASDVGTENHYDNVGRLSDQTTSIDGMSYNFHFDYDPTTFKLKQVSYPAVTSDGRVSLAYTYSSQDGSLSQLDMTHSTAPVWKKTALSDGGQVSGETLGNGENVVHDFDLSTGRLTHIAAGTGALQLGPSGFLEPASSVQSLTYGYDELGRVKSKTDWKLNTAEVYQTYDNFDRLVTWTNGDSTKSVTYDYSDLGNLKARHETTNGVQVNEIYAYGVGAGPHAVTGGPLGSYGYDPNGRQTSRPSQPLLTYNRFDLPDSVQHDNTATVFSYDASGTRTEKQTGTSSTIYVGGLYERRTGPSGVRHIFYVPGAQGAIAQLECTGVNGLATCGSFRYLHADRMGTIDTISSGTDVMRMSHDPYGRVTGVSSDVTLGFTGEEDEVDLGFVNLNHRLYDPKLGRFISPDPLVGFVKSAQDHNRYAYAVNSPTMFTDRTGLQESTDFDVTQCPGCGTPMGEITATGTNVWGPDTIGGVQAGNVPDPTVPPPSVAGPPDLAPDATNPNTNTTVGAPDRSLNKFDFAPITITGNPQAFDPDVYARLEPGPGLKLSGNPQNKFGREAVIDAIRDIGQAWQLAHPNGPRITIRDISKQGGGPLSPHHSHAHGLDVDIRVFRNDGTENKVLVTDKNNYSRELTQELVDALSISGSTGVQYIFTADRQLNAPQLRLDDIHFDHLHVRFFP